MLPRKSWVFAVPSDAWGANVLPLILHHLGAIG
jgi:hypothetical protein